jgi:hypothetical protein
MEALDVLAREIDRLRRLHRRRFLDEAADAREVPAVWEAEEGAILWHVVLADVLEPDVDVEVTEEVIVVRAAPLPPRRRLRVGLLPVPRGFDATRVTVRLEGGRLEVRVLRAEEHGRGP